MHIHILGICGTFMAGLALLAREDGYTVSGCDANVYPPMSTQLATAGIDVLAGYAADHLQLAPDEVVVGNAMTRGMPIVEALLNSQLPYTSGPQWLAEHILCSHWTIAVAGTHGKTSTSAMLAWILEWAGLEPGFLIGGVPGNFAVSARRGAGSFFVIEADEYDSAFFDKRSKFVHYRPRTLILNNLEYDHADIFPDLAAIQRQFHHLVRTVPSEALIIVNGADKNLQTMLKMGCWTPCEQFSQGDWQAQVDKPDGSVFRVYWREQYQGTVTWPLIGQHNMHNAVAAIAAARHIGVTSAHSIQALAEFQGVKRRLELRGVINDIHVYDDFAHHPTAIASTLAGLRASVDQQRIIVLLEPRSNSMRLGVFNQDLNDSLQLADKVLLYQAPQQDWQWQTIIPTAQCYTSVETLIAATVAEVQTGDHVLVMSNGGFANIHERLLQRLGTRQGST